MEEFLLGIVRRLMETLQFLDVFFRLGVDELVFGLQFLLQIFQFLLVFVDFLLTCMLEEVILLFLRLQLLSQLVQILGQLLLHERKTLILQLLLRVS